MVASMRINAATDTPEIVYGINLRAVPQQASVNDPLGTATPPSSGPTDILKRGYVDVQLNGPAAATKDGAVFVRIANATPDKPVGGFEAAADGTNTFQLTNAYFTGQADAYGVTEVALKI